MLQDEIKTIKNWLKKLRSTTINNNKVNNLRDEQLYRLSFWGVID